MLAAVGWGALAIFVSNLPEGGGSASDMRAAGRPYRRIVLLWIGVAGLAGGLMLALGFAVAAGLSSAS